MADVCSDGFLKYRPASALLGIPPEQISYPFVIADH
jgi:hypothetical protein